jgi:hypothetical protein
VIGLDDSAFNAIGYAVVEASTGIVRTASPSGNAPTDAARDAAGNRT